MKGQHSCGSILVPIGRGKGKPEAGNLLADPTGATDDPTKGKGNMRFKWVPMFDILQTEEIGTEPVKELPARTVTVEATVIDRKVVA